MKKDIRKMLSSERENILPSDSVRESIRRELGYGGAGRERAYAGGGKEGGKRRALIPALAACAAVLAALCVAIPLAVTSSSGGVGGISLAEAESNFYAYGIASAASLLPYAGTGFAADAGGVSALSRSALSDRDTDYEEVAAALSGYLPLAESILQTGSIAYESETLSEAYEGFSCSMTVSCDDLLGEQRTYVMYFNETAQATDGEKTEYDIEGILISDGTAYAVTGGCEAEADDEKTEGKYWFLAYTDSTDDSYVLIEQAAESELDDDGAESEAETEIGVWEDGECVRSMEIAYKTETDGGESETELSMSLTEDGEKTEIELRWESGSAELEIEYDPEDGDKVTLTVTVSAGAYTYRFEDGETVVIAR